MIEVYGKQNCPYCVNAKDLLESLELTYRYYDIQEDLSKREELLKRNPGAKTVPQVFIDDALIGGFTELRSHLQDR